MTAREINRASVAALGESVFDPQLDPMVAPWVALLQSHGVETYESCQGGQGHALPEPTVLFHGGRAEGLRALAVALTYDLPVLALRRTWNVIDGEATGPHWEMIFRGQGPDPTN